MNLQKLLKVEDVEVLAEDIEVMNKGQQNEIFIDARTERNEDGINVVKPILYKSPFYYYVCPDCGKIHVTNHIGKIQPGCCHDIDLERYQKINGNMHLIKREPIILDDMDCEILNNSKGGN